MHVERLLGSDRTVFSAASTASQLSSLCLVVKQSSAGDKERTLSKGSDAKSATGKSFVKVPNLNISSIYAKQPLKGEKVQSMASNSSRIQ